MKLYLKLPILLLILLLQVKASTVEYLYCQSTCSQCNRTLFNHPDACRLCLTSLYNRNLTSDGLCTCADNFIENIPSTDYCCPINCASCYKFGCYSCRQNWTLAYIDTYQYYNCTCKPNFYYSDNLKDCICLAESNNIQYYQPSPLQCYSCPMGCTCNQKGCFDCNINTNRFITSNSYSNFLCLCATNFIQLNGNCVIISSTICKSPYVLVNNNCTCQQPYYINQNKICVCKSLVYPNYYYQFNYICYRCPAGCICDKQGCYYCNAAVNRIVQENNCSCRSPSIQVDGICVCIYPYNPNNCGCNSDLYPEKFYYRSNVCKQCPSGCICNKLGYDCYSCSSVSQYRNKDCTCVTNYIQIDGKCRYCGNNFIIKNGACICPSQNNSSFSISFYYDSQTNKCYKCPSNCVCDATGCKSCSPSSYRIITTNSFNKKICLCGTNSAEDSNGLCKCTAPYVYDPTTNTCKCTQPFYIHPNSQRCVCKYFMDSSNYYPYSETDCRLCPVGCLCNAIGCMTCLDSVGRTIIITAFQQYICPCLPIVSNYTEKFCNACPIGQYQSQKRCLDCDMSCLECNQLGCLTCQLPTKIKNSACVCTNDDVAAHVYNYNKTCICRPGYYTMDSANIICLQCPLNCQICAFLLLSQDIPNCLSCSINSFRKIEPNHQCPCIDYYTQSKILQMTYCCHWSCYTCDLLGCTTCIAFTNRYLNTSNPKNKTCDCNPGYIETYQTKCICPQFFYQKFYQCLSCPFECYKCQDINGGISCIQCTPQTNTVKYKYITGGFTYTTCLCKTNFTHLSNNDGYCYDRFCGQGTNGNCHICMNQRNLNKATEVCECPKGSYETRLLVCQKCFQGCLVCLQKYKCNLCNSAQNYNLIIQSNTNYYMCIKENKLNTLVFVQNDDSIIFQIKISQIKISGNTLINPIINIHTKGSINTIEKLQIISSIAINQNTVQIITHSVKKMQQKKSIIQIYFQYKTQNSNSNNISEIYFNLNYPLYPMFITFSSETIKIVLEVVTGFLILLFFIMTALFNIKGLKQNQILYFMQTIYFLSYNINDINMDLIPKLNYFKWSILSFYKLTSYSISPFDPLVKNWRDYIQTSPGNFKYFVNDSNIFRNCGLCIFLALLNGVVSIILRILYRRTFSLNFFDPLRQNVEKNKKNIYRFLDWIYKLTMYPNLFFSILTIAYYKYNFSLGNQNYRYLSYLVSIVILVVYTVQVFLHFIFQDISRYSKYDKVSEYIFNILTSLVICFTFFSSNAYLLIMVIILRGIFRILIQKYLKRSQFRQNNISRMIRVLLQIITIIMIHKIQYIPALFFVSFTFFYELIIKLIQFHKILTKKTYNKNQITISNKKIQNPIGQQKRKKKLTEEKQDSANNLNLPSSIKGNL